MALCHYERFVPAGVRIESANTLMGFDKDVYVECNFFGEDDTRSYLMRMTSERFTKIVNVPNMKDHPAIRVFIRDCLKNIAYGEFDNVARSHYKAKTENTLTFIGTLANVEPVRSRTVAADHGRTAGGLARRAILNGTPSSSSTRSR